MNFSTTLLLGKYIWEDLLIEFKARGNVNIEYKVLNSQCLEKVIYNNLI